MGEDENWLHHDHVAFEASLEDCREAVEAEDWTDAKRLFSELVSDLKLHMRIGEEALYPTYEQVMGTAEEFRQSGLRRSPLAAYSRSAP